jgi:hypothetical protein
VDKFKFEKELVKINYLPGKIRYYRLTDKTGCPSAEFRYPWGDGVVVSDPRPSSADP